MNSAVTPDIEEDETILGMHNMLNDKPLTPEQKKALIVYIKKQAALVAEWEEFQRTVEKRWLLIKRAVYAGLGFFAIYLPTTFRKIALFFNWLAEIVEKLV